MTEQQLGLVTSNGVEPCREPRPAFKGRETNSDRSQAGLLDVIDIVLVDQQSANGGSGQTVASNEPEEQFEGGSRLLRLGSQLVQKILSDSGLFCPQANVLRLETSRCRRRPGNNTDD